MQPMSLSPAMNPFELIALKVKFEKKVEGYCLASDASFAAKFKYALYRILNAVKAIFNRSDWQCARRELGVEIRTRVNAQLKPLSEIPGLAIKIELNKADAETFAEALLYVSIDTKIKKTEKMTLAESNKKFAAFKKEGTNLAVKLFNKFNIDILEIKKAGPPDAQKTQKLAMDALTDPQLMSKLRECNKEIAAFVIKLDVAEKATVNACSKCVDVALKIAEPSVQKFMPLVMMAMAMAGPGPDDMDDMDPMGGKFPEMSGFPEEMSGFPGFYAI